MTAATPKTGPQPSTGFRKTITGGSLMNKCPSLTLATLLLAPLAVSHAVAEPIPFPAALDAARIRQEQLDDIMENSLILGNGDINAVLHGSGRSLVLRLTKNDVWDARIGCADDPPLLKIDVKNKKLDGPTDGPMPSWDKPYPCPRVCARLVLGRAEEPAWQRIRAEGRVNDWSNRDGAAVMAIEGREGASNGFAYGLLDVSTDRYPTLRLKLHGSSNARFFVDLLAPDGRPIFSSLWIDSPHATEERTFKLPPGNKVHQIILYTWTVDGKRAENRFYAAGFEGPGGKLAVDLQRLSRAAASVLDLRRAAARIGERGETVVRALAQRNAFLIHSPQPAHLDAALASYLPAPEHGEEKGVEWVRQQLPADPDWPGMAFAVALAADGDRKAVAIVTSLESKDPLADALGLARSTLTSADASLIAEHEAIWEKFWSASGVNLDDAELRAMWYRNLYFLRCVSKPGVEAIGLYAGLTNDSPPWHGSHTLNYNSQQTFWGSYICNHAELSEPYERMIFRYLPRARWFCRQTYGFDGAHLPHNVFTHELPEPEKCRSKNNRMHAFPPFAYTIGVSGHAVQNIWLHYKFCPDRRFLEEVAYPAMRDVATFYANFIEQCERTPSGKVVLAPSFSPEHWSLTPDFKRNRNCAYDIAYARYTLRAAIEGATVLRRDAERVERFKRAEAALPDYPLSKDPEPIGVDVEDAPPSNYNIAVPVVPVFPADDITWFSPEPVKRQFIRTVERVQWNGYNSSIIMPVARARLSFPDAKEFMKTEFLKRSRPNGTITLQAGDGCGHFTEQFAAAGAIAELLLQSVGDIIRVFPAWPKEKDAEFATLRAQGGFLVSAEQRAGKLAKLEIVSTVGGKLRLMDPWSAKLIERETKPGEKMEFKP